MEADTLDFVEQCRQLVKQAPGKHAGEPTAGGFARWKHVVLHCLRLEDGHSYRETPNRVKYMAETRDALGLDQDDLPDYGMIYESFDRLVSKMRILRLSDVDAVREEFNEVFGGIPQLQIERGEGPRIDSSKIHTEGTAKEVDVQELLDS